MTPQENELIVDINAISDTLMLTDSQRAELLHDGIKFLKSDQFKLLHDTLSAAADIEDSDIEVFCRLLSEDPTMYLLLH